MEDYRFEWERSSTRSEKVTAWRDDGVIYWKTFNSFLTFYCFSQSSFPSHTDFQSIVIITWFKKQNWSSNVWMIGWLGGFASVGGWLSDEYQTLNCFRVKLHNMSNKQSQNTQGTVEFLCKKVNYYGNFGHLSAESFHLARNKDQEGSFYRLSEIKLFSPLHTDDLESHKIPLWSILSKHLHSPLFPFLPPLQPSFQS